MVIQFQTTNILNPYTKGEIKNTQGESKETKNTVHAGKLLSQQEYNQKSQTERLYEQIERTKETIKGIKENEKMSRSTASRARRKIKRGAGEKRKRKNEPAHT